MDMETSSAARKQDEEAIPPLPSHPGEEDHHGRHGRIARSCRGFESCEVKPLCSQPALNSFIARGDDYFFPTCTHRKIRSDRSTSQAATCWSSSFRHCGYSNPPPPPSPTSSQQSSQSNERRGQTALVSVFLLLLLVAVSVVVCSVLDRGLLFGHHHRRLVIDDGEQKLKGSIFSQSRKKQLNSSSVSSAPRTTIMCRLISMETLFEISPSSSLLRTERDTECVPIILLTAEGDKNREGETDGSYIEGDESYKVLQLPKPFFLKHQVEIERGELYVSISHVITKSDGLELLLSNSSSITVLGAPTGNHVGSVATTGSGNSPSRFLEKRFDRLYQPGTMGQRTIAVVRVSTTDSSLNATAKEIHDALFSARRINFISQYRACSFNKLRWTRSKYGVVDVKLNRPITSFSGAAEVIQVATSQYKTEFKFHSAMQLADNVMFCIPPGTGNWAASAGVNFWRSQFNNEWCTSLTATVHELGHNLGLLHSNENGEPYGDRTGFMAGGYKNQDWPVKCFNGHKNWVLGWYKDRQLELNPVTDSVKLIRLAAFVDYQKATKDEPVLVNIMDRLFLQYNRAKDFNRETEEKQNKVTITEATNVGSDNRAGLGFGERFEYQNFDGKGGTLIIEVCDIAMGGDDKHRADAILVSVGMGVVLCARDRNPRYASRPTPPAQAPQTGPPTITVTTSTPTTSPPATPNPTTGTPTSLEPTTATPTTMSPTTVAPTTPEPTTFPTEAPTDTGDNCGSLGVLCPPLASVITNIPTAVSTTNRDCNGGSGVLCLEKPNDSAASVSPTSFLGDKQDVKVDCGGGSGMPCDKKATRSEPTLPAVSPETAISVPSNASDHSSSTIPSTSAPPALVKSKVDCDAEHAKGIPCNDSTRTFRIPGRSKESKPPITHNDCDELGVLCSEGRSSTGTPAMPMTHPSAAPKTLPSRITFDDARLPADKPPSTPAPALVNDTHSSSTPESSSANGREIDNDCDGLRVICANKSIPTTNLPKPRNDVTPTDAPASPSSPPPENAADKMPPITKRLCRLFGFRCRGGKITPPLPTAVNTSNAERNVDCDGSGVLCDTTSSNNTLDQTKEKPPLKKNRAVGAPPPHVAPPITSKLCLLFGFTCRDRRPATSPSTSELYPDGDQSDQSGSTPSPKARPSDNSDNCVTSGILCGSEAPTSSATQTNSPGSSGSNSSTTATNSLTFNTTYKDCDRFGIPCPGRTEGKEPPGPPPPPGGPAHDENDDRPSGVGDEALAGNARDRCDEFGIRCDGTTETPRTPVNESNDSLSVTKNDGRVENGFPVKDGSSGKKLDGPQPSLPPAFSLDRVFDGAEYAVDIDDEIASSTDSKKHTADPLWLPAPTATPRVDIEGGYKSTRIYSPYLGPNEPVASPNSAPAQAPNDHHTISDPGKTARTRESITYLRLGPDRGGVAFEGIFDNDADPSSSTSGSYSDGESVLSSSSLPPPGFVDPRPAVEVVLLREGDGGKGRSLSTSIPEPPRLQWPTRPG